MIKRNKDFLAIFTEKNISFPLELNLYSKFNSSSISPNSLHLFIIKWQYLFNLLQIFTLPMRI